MTRIYTFAAVFDLIPGIIDTFSKLGTCEDAFYLTIFLLLVLLSKSDFC